ncbi:MAG TPA: hypothetical protein ENK98_08585 [Epsilonproteobacteria bacterium]|nr:hypothetical protein [Campylobacterota bacterium]
MKAETQAHALASLVQQKKHYPEYELILPSFEVKQSSLKKLDVGDVLLVGLDMFTLLLVSSSDICAHVKIVNEENMYKLKITNLEKDTLKQVHTKKYEILKCSFGMLQSRKLEVGYKVSISQLDLQKVRLFVKEKNIAEARLVEVDDEIAIEITKVKNV